MADGAETNPLPDRGARNHLATGAKEATKSSVFISYAREDDEPFVQRLRGALVAHGVRVWWDREAMESRGRTFLQELRDAIAAVDRVLLVVGPGAARSDYVDAERRFAAERCTPIVPLFRKGGYDTMPALALFHGVDFRESRTFDDAIQELLRLVGTPVPRLADMHGIPQLPPHYLPRADLAERLEALVLGDVQGPPGEVQPRRLTSLHGMAGSGKSVLAATFAQSCASRRTFGDGVVWLRLGRGPNLVVLLQAAGRTLGDPDTHLYTDIRSSVDALTAFLSARSVLIVADDAWRLDDIEPLVGVAGQRGHLLFTTRDRRVASDVAARELAVDLLTPDQSTRLLASWSNTDIDRLPSEAFEVARECGYLPLALSIMGATVRGRPQRWSNVLQRLRNADLRAIERQLPNYPYPNLIRAMDVSLEALDSRTVERYVDLALFAGTDGFPAEVVRTYWAPLGLTPLDVDDLLDRLEDCSLLHRAGSGRLTLHDLQYDYVLSRIDDRAVLHRRLLDAYAARFPGAWWDGPDDGYFFQHLPQHLLGAGREREQAELLLDFRWMRAKLNATSAGELIADMSPPQMLDEHGLLADALRLSAHIIEDGRQLCSQLLGRLLSRQEPGLAGLLNQIAAGCAAAGADLLPLRQSLTAPGGPFLKTFRGLVNVTWLGPVDELGRVTTAATDGVIAVRDTRSGEATTRLETGMTLTDAAITPDGRFVAVVAGKNDGFDSAANVAHVWDVSTGTSPCLLRPEGRHVNRVYALHDNRRMMTLSVSATPEQTWQTVLCIWGLPDGELLASVDLPTALWHVASSSDDSFIAAAGYTGLIVILDGALSVRNILRSDLGVDRLALSDDGRTLIVACHRAETSVPFVGESNADSVRRMKQAMRNDPFWDGVDLYQESGKGDGFGLRIWNVGTGELQHSIDGAHRERISMLQPVAGDETYLSSGWDGNLTLWETGSADPINTIAAHDTKIVGLAVSRDGDRAVSVAEDDTLKVWNLRAMHARQGESDHRGPVVTMALPPDGSHVVTGSHDGALKIWGAEHGDLVRTLAPLQGLNDAAFADSARLVCAVNRTIQVVDLAGTDAPVVPGEHEALARSVRVGGTHCVSAGDDGTLRVWDLRGLDAPSIIECAPRSTYQSNDPDPFSFLDVTTDGRYAAAVTYAFQADFGKGMRTLLLVDLESGEVRTLDSVFAYWPYHHDTVLVSDQRLLVSAQYGTVGVWDLATGERRRTLDNDGSSIVAITATHDGSGVIAAMGDRTLAGWKLSDGTLTFRSKPIEADFAFLGSASGRGDFVSASTDGAIQLWGAVPTEPRAVFTADATIIDAQFTCNAERIVAVDASGHVHILRVARG